MFRFFRLSFGSFFFLGICHFIKLVKFIGKKFSRYSYYSFTIYNIYSDDISFIPKIHIFFIYQYDKGYINYVDLSKN